MTLLDLARLYNFSGVATILLVSLLVSRKYPSSFFKPWLQAYLGGTMLLFCEVISATYMHFPAFQLIEIGLAASITWCFVQTGLLLEGEAWPARRLGVWLSLVLGVAAGALAAGLPYMAVFTPVVLIYSTAHIWLGWRLLRCDRRSEGAPNPIWLGWPLITSGLWFYTFPVLVHSPFAWFGYLVSGILNMLVGLGMVLFLVDRTARSLQKRHDVLETAHQHSADFIHTMSHELRTPLNSIKQASFMMGRMGHEPLNDQQQELLEIIGDQSNLLGRLVADLVDFSRVESGLLACHLEPENLVTLVEKAARALGKEFANADIRLEVVHEDDSLDMLLDDTRIMQVVTNLLVNAKKFTPKGGDVTVRIFKEGDNGVFEVQDTGIGISADQQTRIFQKYYQVDLANTRRFGGLGLGLTISKAIVEEGHGGSLSVRSTPGGGSTFRVELPILVIAAAVL